MLALAAAPITPISLAPLLPQLGFSAVFLFILYKLWDAYQKRGEELAGLTRRYEALLEKNIETMTSLCKDLEDKDE